MLRTEECEKADTSMAALIQGHGIRSFLFYSFQHITKFTQNLTLFDSGKHFITREFQL